MGENLVLGLFAAVPCLAGWLLFLLARAIRRSGRKAGWLHLALGNGLVLLILVGLASFAGEIYYRFGCDTTDALLYTKISRRWIQRHWYENADGIRDKVVYTLPLAPGRHRVSFVGDSFTAGHGIKDMENRFVNLIRRKHPDWEVHLLALPGLDTQEELDFLSGSVKNGYQLDEVVLVYCMNDVSDLLPQRDEGIARVQKELREMPWLPRNSYLVNTLYHRLKVRLDPFFKNYFGFVRDAYRGPLWEKQKQRLTQFRDFVQSHGGRLAVVTFPFLQLLGPNYEYQFAHQELGQLWRGLGVPQLDLLTIYKELPPAKITVNRFDPHPNEYAHALAAEAIDEFLREQMKDLKTANDRE